jgi:UDP-2,3-diacylglucosamine pyrophosphatase LpxH
VPDAFSASVPPSEPDTGASGGRRVLSGPVVIISDVHLGSRHCLYAEFSAFLDRLPEDTALVLNGDIDCYRFRGSGDLQAQREAALARLREESRRRRIVWVRGNHDWLRPDDDLPGILFVPDLAIDGMLFVAHGHVFDRLKPHSLPLIWLFRTLHRVHVLLGAESMHVARYAKRYPRLYGILRRHVAHRAVAFARRNGYAAVACGHTHFAEDILSGDVRYLNTGSWTETPVFQLRVDSGSLELEKIVD